MVAAREFVCLSIPSALICEQSTARTLFAAACCPVASSIPAKTPIPRGRRVTTDLAFRCICLYPPFRLPQSASWENRANWSRLCDAPAELARKCYRFGLGGKIYLQQDSR